jgi:hypothetical protein
MAFYSLVTHLINRIDPWSKPTMGILANLFFCVKPHLNLQVSTKIGSLIALVFLLINELEVGLFLSPWQKKGKNLAN